MITHMMITPNVHNQFHEPPVPSPVRGQEGDANTREETEYRPGRNIDTEGEIRWIFDVLRCTAVRRPLDHSVAEAAGGAVEVAPVFGVYISGVWRCLEVFRGVYMVYTYV